MHPTAEGATGGLPASDDRAGDSPAFTLISRPDDLRCYPDRKGRSSTCPTYSDSYFQLLTGLVNVLHVPSGGVAILFPDRFGEFLCLFVECPVSMVLVFFKSADAWVVS